MDQWSNFEFVSWTANGDGFFVNAGFAARSEHHAALIRVDSDGRSHILETLPVSGTSVQKRPPTAGISRSQACLFTATFG